MTEMEKKALARIEIEADPDRLLTMIRNAHGKSSVVERAAIRRFAEVSAKNSPGTVEHDCWRMVHVIETLRELKGRRPYMGRLRPKIKADGEVTALAYCALNRTDGFGEVMEYGMPELTAEAIVLQHPGRFGPDVPSAARKRLAEAGVHVGPDGSVAAAPE
ncbi:hypothetical protein NPA31_018890 [Aurantimonas sp. MSK8Z-1]|uniref:hypothetical protein n=1 Tax=Mangrovibrevibacter kandeliae TaxID=2968473 RepID=UPI0021198865|nr:hypothetical protein [Aurantimonas sp. MSK8Z-1]MCW4117031.1 hypothetical protein [Aurantimonas sp. MSK8Z-1]